jgi:hypothetical protein
MMADWEGAPYAPSFRHRLSSWLRTLVVLRQPRPVSLFFKGCHRFFDFLETALPELQLFRQLLLALSLAIEAIFALISLLSLSQQLCNLLLKLSGFLFHAAV